MNSKMSFCFLLLASFLASIDAHGRLVDPMNRASLGRTFPDMFPGFPAFVNENEWCGSPLERLGERPVSCGVCGPIYNNNPAQPFQIINPVAGNRVRTANVTSYERNSVSFRNFPSMAPFITQTYRAGDWIEPKYRLDNNHNGTMEFRICRVTNPRVDPTPACFNANPLEFEDGNTVRDINNAQLRGWFDHSPTGVSTTGNGTHQVHVYRVKLPDNFVCNHCLFQMRWDVNGRGHQYIACSDIRIIRDYDQV